MLLVVLYRQPIKNGLDRYYVFMHHDQLIKSKDIHETITQRCNSDVITYIHMYRDNLNYWHSKRFQIYQFLDSLLNDKSNIFPR